MTFKTLSSLTALTLGTALVAGAAAAQDATKDAQDMTRDQDATWIDITSWNDDAVYDGWSAQSLLGEDAYNATGDELGEVEDLIVGPDGMIRRVVIEGGGFLDIGDTHAAIPWDEVQRNAASSVSVPLQGEDLDDYTRYPNVDDMRTEAENFRVREVIGDFVTAEGTGYGSIDDVVFDDSGQMTALVVRPNPSYGYRGRWVAMPYSAGTYDPRAAYTEVPYSSVQLDELRPFNYGNFR
ncbi:PRC-barrel domain-containing protein [Cribrihabitans sp. XS_ASV171]